MVCQASYKDRHSLFQGTRLKEERWPTQVEEFLKSYFSRKNDFSVEKNCLLWRIRVMFLAILAAATSSRPTRHLKHGSHVLGPGLNSDLEQLASSCLSCQGEKNASLLGHSSARHTSLPLMHIKVARDPQEESQNSL